MMSDSEQMRYERLISLAVEAAPPLVPLLEQARSHGMVVKRYQSGDKAGMLYLSMSHKVGGDYSQWSYLNCGPGLEMYQRVQVLSKGA